MDTRNIFSSLGKYNSARDEDYFTEAFVFIINTLLDTDRPMAIDILNRLCVNDKEFSFIQTKSFQLILKRLLIMVYPISKYSQINSSILRLSMILP